MSETAVIHPDWDVEKATAHLADLREDLGKLEAVAQAFQDAADEADREAGHRRSQIRHCERMFSRPRETPQLSDLRVHEATAATTPADRAPGTAEGGAL